MADAKAIAGALAGALACGGAAWGAVTLQAGCQLQGSCQPETVYMPQTPAGITIPEGTTVTAQAFPAGAGVTNGVWQSGPIDGTWLNYPGSITYEIYPQLPDGGPFVGPYVFNRVPMISPDPNPYTTSSAPGAGNLTEFAGLADGGVNGFTITNDTCSGYYLWFQVAQANAGTAAPGAPAVPVATEAGAD